MLVSYFSLTVLKILIGIGAVCWQHQVGVQVRLARASFLVVFRHWLATQEQRCEVFL